MLRNETCEYVDVYETIYFGLKVRAFTTKGTLKYYSSFPWCFEIEYQGKIVSFSGIPNHVETKRKALKRAFYRAKWLDEGTFSRHYR